MPKKKKRYQAIFEKSTFKWKVDDRQTDGRTMEKLRCLSAGGAKKLSNRFWEIKLFSEKLTITTDKSASEKLRCLSAEWAKNLQLIKADNESINTSYVVSTTL